MSSVPVEKTRHRASSPVIVNGSALFAAVANGVGQHYFWTPAWQEGERNASQDLQSGGYRDFETADEALDWIFDGQA